MFWAEYMVRREKSLLDNLPLQKCYTVQSVKKHLAVIFSILALLISLISVGLSYYWDQQTIRDISVIYNNQKNFQELGEKYEARLKDLQELIQLFCERTGIGKNCENQ